MEFARDGAKLVPLRYRGSREFAEMRKDVVLTLGSLTLESGSNHCATTPKAAEGGKGDDPTTPTSKRIFEGCSTYKSDFVQHELPRPWRDSATAPAERRVPFEATTTYRSDFKRSANNDTESPIAAGCRRYR